MTVADLGRPALKKRVGGDIDEAEGASATAATSSGVDAEPIGA
jgi:hypothetical protein